MMIISLGVWLCITLVVQTPCCYRHTSNKLQLPGKDDQTTIRHGKHTCRNSCTLPGHHGCCDRWPVRNQHLSTHLTNTIKLNDTTP